MTTHFTAPHSAAAIRNALGITDPQVRIILDTDTRTVYSDYTGQIADLEVRVYAPDYFENLYVEAADVHTAIENLSDCVDVDTVEIVLEWAYAEHITTPTIQAAA